MKQQEKPKQLNTKRGIALISEFNISISDGPTAIEELESLTTRIINSIQMPDNAHAKSEHEPVLPPLNISPITFNSASQSDEDLAQVAKQQAAELENF